MKQILNDMYAYMLKAYDYVTHIDSLDWNTFITAFQYELSLIGLLILSIIMFGLAIAFIFLPLFILWIIETLLLRHYCKGKTNLYKVHQLYALDNLSDTLYVLSSYACAYHVHKFYHHWLLIHHIEFLPEQKQFHALLVDYTKHYMTNEKEYNKKIENTIKQFKYVDITRDFEKQIKSYINHVNKIMIPISICTWILWLLVLTPIVCSLINMCI